MLLITSDGMRSRFSTHLSKTFTNSDGVCADSENSALTEVVEASLVDDLAVRALGLCCKSRKLQSHDCFAKTRDGSDS